MRSLAVGAFHQVLHCGFLERLDLILTFVATEDKPISRAKIISAGLLFKLKNDVTDGSWWSDLEPHTHPACWFLSIASTCYMYGFKMYFHILTFQRLSHRPIPNLMRLLASDQALHFSVLLRWLGAFGSSVEGVLKMHWRPWPRGQNECICDRAPSILTTVLYAIFVCQK